MKLQLKPYREQTFLRRGFNLLGVLFVSLVLLELVLRVTGFVLALKISHVPEGSGRASAYTILCIGDSWTAGQPEGNYPDFLRDMLGQAYPQQRWDVVNSGRGGFNSSQGLHLLVKNIPTYRPNMVIVMLGNNDHWNLTESTYWQFQDAQFSARDIVLSRG